MAMLLYGGQLLTIPPDASSQVQSFHEETTPEREEPPASFWALLEKEMDHG